MRKSVMFLCAALLAVPTVSLGAVGDDQVTSVKIREADNSGSQDTNSGSGVKTNHIQNFAITGEKIADGAVTDVKISGTISSSKISGTVGNADTLDGKHAVEFAPSGHVHGQAEVIGLDAALAGKADAAHSHGGLYQEKYANVVVVAKYGGDFTDPASAVDSITDASANNPYLVKIMPGVYDIGTASVHTRPYVDIEGSGEGITTITSSVTPVLGSLIVGDGAPAALRNLTVELAVQGSANCSAVKITADVTISGVTVEVNHSSPYMSYAFYMGYCSPVLKDVTVELLGYVHQGIMCVGGSPRIVNTTVSGTATSPWSEIGINLWDSNAVLDRVAVVLSSAGSARGIVASNTYSAPHPITLKDVSIDVHGVEFAYAMEIDGVSSATMRDVVANAAGSTNSIGLYSEAGSFENELRIENSNISGAGKSLETAHQVFVSNSRLTGAINAPAGLMKCANVIDGSNDPVVCP